MQIETFLRHDTFDDTWPVWVCRIFRNYSVKDIVFRKNYWLWHLNFDFVWKSYLKLVFISRRIQRDIIMNVRTVFQLNAWCFCSIINQLEFSRQSFIKICQCKISQRYVQWEKSCSVQADRQTWLSSQSRLVFMRPLLQSKKNMASGLLTESRIFSFSNIWLVSSCNLITILLFL